MAGRPPAESPEGGVVDCTGRVELSVPVCAGRTERLSRSQSRGMIDKILDVLVICPILRTSLEPLSKLLSFTLA